MVIREIYDDVFPRLLFGLTASKFATYGCQLLARVTNRK